MSDAGRAKRTTTMRALIRCEVETLAQFPAG